MNIVKVVPRDELKPVVKQFWYTTVQNPENSTETYRILADGAPGIIFQHYNGHSAVVGTEGLPLPISFFYGQSTGPCINHITGGSFIFGINFRPTAFKTLFSVDTSELTDTTLDIEYLFSGQFREQLINTFNPNSIISLFSEQLLQRLPQHKQQRMIDESISLIMQKTTEINSEALSSQYNISKRQFQRQFKAYAGVCPETYIRIVKFQRSIYLLRNRKYDKLSDIAYQLNYADQSHFNREFKLFLGCTPKEFLEINTHKQTFYENNTRSFEPIRIVQN